MNQGHHHSPGQQPFRPTPDRGRRHLRHRHPVLLPLLLLSGSAGLGIASLFADTLFPVLAFIGAPVGPLCLALAWVLGITGLLTGIIGILESIDRHCLKAAIYLKPKEQSYGN
jgi:hypothetical protein